MQAHSAAHKNRHFKTLILLVVSMTAGAFFLFWLGQMTPVTPLRGKTKAAASWNRISVRTSPRASTEAGFFHLRIDESGRLYQTAAWKSRIADPQKAGAIQIVLSAQDAATGISSAQEKALARLIGDLRRQFSISARNVDLERGPALAAAFDSGGRSALGL